MEKETSQCIKCFDTNEKTNPAKMYRQMKRYFEEVSDEINWESRTHGKEEERMELSEEMDMMCLNSAHIQTVIKSFQLVVFNVLLQSMVQFIDRNRNRWNLLITSNKIQGFLHTTATKFRI